MEEENKVTPSTTPVEPKVEAATTPEVAPVQPTVEPVQPAEPAPIQPTVQPVAQPEPPKEEVPVQPTVEPAPAVTPTVEPTPAVEPAPAIEPVPVVQPEPTPVAVTPTVEAAPATAIDGTTVVASEQNSGVQPSSGLSSMNNVGDVSSVGFVPTGEGLKKKPNKVLKAVIIILILIILGLLGYFIIYPFIVKTYISKPKKVYTETIKVLSKEISDTITTPIHDKGIYDISVTLDTNVNSLSSFSGYTYGVNLGVDPSTKAVQYGMYIKDPTGTENSFYNYLKDGKNYQRFSDYEKLVYIGELKESYNGSSIEDQLGASFEEIFTQRNRVSKEDIEYLIGKIRDLLINSLDEDKLYKDDASLNIDGNNLKVLAHHYTMDVDNQLRTSEFMLNGLLNDDKAVEIIAKISEVSKEDMVKQFEESLKGLKDYKKTDDDIDYDIVIYTYGLKTEVIGYAINTKNNGSMHYYAKGNDIELVINNKVKKLETEESVDTTLKAVGKKNGTIKVTVDEKEVATFNIRSLEKNKIDFDYEYVVEEEGKYSGTIKLIEDTNDTRTKYEFEFSMSINGESIKLKGNAENDWTSEVANINTKAAVNMTDYELETRHNEFLNSLTNTPIGSFFTTTDGLTDPSINNYYMRNIEDISYVCNYIDANGNYISDDQTIECNGGTCTINQNGSIQSIDCLN